MSRPSKLGAVSYEAESSFGEDVTTFANRITTLGMVDVSGLQHTKIAPDRVTTTLQGGTQWILGNQTGTFKTKVWLTGHGSSTSGTPTLGITETLLGAVFGNVALSAAAGTTLTGGTATVPLTTASGTFSAGSMPRIGVFGDGRGNGQFVAVSTHVTTSLNLLTAIDATPNAADVLYDSAMIYPNELSTGTAVTGQRFLLQTGNLQYECHGCYATSASFSGLNTNEVPAVEITWAVSWWRYSTATFPTALPTEVFQPAANATGSLFVNDVVNGVATTTRAKRTFRNFTLDWTLGRQALPGPGGVGQYQGTVGAVRTGDTAKVSWVEDADTATTTPVLPGWGTATTAKHALLTLNPTATKAVGFYFPNLCITNVAIQYADQNINRLKVEAMAYTGPTVTNDLTASAVRIAFA